MGRGSGWRATVVPVPASRPRPAAPVGLPAVGTGRAMELWQMDIVGGVHLVDGFVVRWRRCEHLNLGACRPGAQHFGASDGARGPCLGPDCWIMGVGPRAARSGVLWREERTEWRLSPRLDERRVIPRRGLSELRPASMPKEGSKAIGPQVIAATKWPDQILRRTIGAGKGARSPCGSTDSIRGAGSVGRAMTSCCSRRASRGGRGPGTLA